MRSIAQCAPTIDTEVQVRKTQVLKDHKRRGKLFIPPLKQLENFRSYSYLNDMLPELIWLGLINDKLGFVAGAEFARKLAVSFSSIVPAESHRNFAFASAFKSLSENDHQRIIATLSDCGILAITQSLLSPLTCLYDNFPLSFIGRPDNPASGPDLLGTIRESIKRHSDKFDTPGIILNGSVFQFRLATNKIKISSKIDLPDLESVVDAPGTEEAKRAASFLRAHAIGEFGMAEIDPAWARFFWDENFELSPCEFQEDTHE